MYWHRLFISAIAFLFCTHIYAQNESANLAASDDDPEQELEQIYDRIEDEEATKAEKRRQDERRKQLAEEKKEKSKNQPTTLSDLGQLAPFEDVAVIQKRYLPRSDRLEMSALGAISTNNQFFNNVGVSLKLAYYFHEKYAIEGTYLYLTSDERPVTDGLKEKQNIKTASLVEPESYLGVAFKWSPFYGKVAWFQEKIIPFDIYITPGFGITSTGVGEDETTFSLGAGQLFAISKSSAIRWDITWNFYSATVIVDGNKETQNHNDLFLMIGYSYYIPEATYR